MIQRVKKIGGSLGRLYFTKCLIPLHRRPKQKNEFPISVHMLTSSRFVVESIVAVQSFEYATQRRWEMVFHDDGRLAEADVKKLKKYFPDCRVVLRSEADAMVNKHLEMYPSCLKERNRWQLMCKLFDPPFFAPHRRFILLDSDVLFYQTPKKLLEWANDAKESCWFNRGWEDCTAIETAQLETFVGRPLWRFVNSGLCFLTKDALSLDLSEQILSQVGDTAPLPSMWEQTLFAVHASRFGQGGLLPEMYEISHNFWKRRDAIARHYVGYQKYDQLFIEGSLELTRRMLIPQIMRLKKRQN